MHDSRTIWRGLRAGLLALLGPPYCVVATPAASQSPPDCQIDEIQRLFDETPQQHAQIEAMLEDCRSLGLVDWRVPTLQGVEARNKGDMDRAIRLLQEAYDLDPQQGNVRSELAFTLVQRAARERDAGDFRSAEVDLLRSTTLDPTQQLGIFALGNLYESRGEYRKAKPLYDSLHSSETWSRNALLGLARIARAQERWSDAEQIYAELLERDPSDTEARAGRAFVYLGDYRLSLARAEFAELLGASPNDEVFRKGLADSLDTSLFQLDINTGVVTADAGTALFGNADMIANLNRRSQIALGYSHYGSELPVAVNSISVPLPSESIRAAFINRKLGSHNFDVSYDLRLHRDLPDEHWIRFNGSAYVVSGMQITAGFQQGLGAPVWENRYIRTGVTVDVAPRWQVSGNAWFEHYKIASSKNATTLSMDVRRFGQEGGLLELGAAYNREFDNLALHGRAVLPVGRGALLLSAEKATINDTIRATLGWRFRW